jgi:Ca2+-binding RTX toxin-like protein
MAISPAVAAKRATIECPRAGACLGTSGPDRILGTPGRDDVRGRDGNDVMDGKSGADVMRGGGGLDSVRGGDGDDTLYAGPVADTRRQEFEWLRGGRGRDVLYGGVLDHLSGDEGADVLYGSRGLQWLLGGDGDDVLHGEGGHDYYFFQGSWGHDVVFDSPPREPGRLENYIGFTEVYVDLTIDLRSDAAAPEVSTADASLTIDWANDAITMVQSGDGDDTIHGNALENLISTAGDDVVYGHEGDDVVQQGSWSNVTVDMGEGDDEVTMWDEAPGTPDVIDCGEGDADEVTYDPEDTVVNCEILHEVPFNRQ